MISTRPTWESVKDRWPNAASSRFVAAGDVTWHVHVAGRGPAVLLLHGTGAASFSWRDVLPALAGEATVIVPDLPGHGFTSATGGLSIAGMARALDALLTALDVTPTVIAGHSAGVAVALRYALDHADAPRAIVGFGAALVAPPEVYRQALGPIVGPLVLSPFAAQAASRVAQLPGVARAVLRATGSPITAEQERLYTTFFRSPSHCAAAFEMMANWDVGTLMREATRLTLPITLLHGANDGFIKPEALRVAAAALPSATVTIVDGAGHLLHEQRPAVAVEAIRVALGSSETLNTGPRQHTP
jgi:magnesium chelatase accessory protein